MKGDKNFVHSWEFWSFLENAAKSSSWVVFDNVFARMQTILLFVIFLFNQTHEIKSRKRAKSHLVCLIDAFELTLSHSLKAFG